MTDPKAVMRALVAAFEARDADRAMDLFAEDAIIEADIARIRRTDPRSLRELLSEVLETYEWLRFEPRMLLSNDRQAAYLANVTGRFGKDVQMFGYTVPTTGKGANVDTAFFLELNDAGQISWFVRVG